MPGISDLYSNMSDFLANNMLYGTTVRFDRQTSISDGIAQIQATKQAEPDYNSLNGIYKGILENSAFTAEGFNTVPTLRG